MKPNMIRLMYITNQVTYFPENMKVIIEAAKNANIEIFWAANFSHYVGDVDEIPCKRIQIDFCRHPLISIKNYRAINQIVDSIKKFDIQALHCNTTIGSFCGRIAAQKANIHAVMYTAHGLPYYKGAPMSRNVFKMIEYWLAHYTDYAVAMNHEDYDEFSKMKLRKKNVALINGVGIPIKQIDAETRRKKREELGIADNVIVIASVGRLEKVKGYDVGLKALSRLNNQNVLMLICGVGPEKNNLESLCHQLSINNKVRFLGFRDDVFDILQASDIYLLTSYYEGLPRSQMEAMNAGLPCIVSDARGNIDLVNETESGVIVKRGDVEATASAINDLINNEELRKRLGGNGSNMIEKYSSSAIVKQYTDIYRKFVLSCLSN